MSSAPSVPGQGVPGQVVPIGSLMSPGGAQGPIGAGGPTIVSSDPGNIAILGSDGLIFVGESALQSIVTPTIWSVRARSFNALGNPNMEVGQWDCGTAYSTSTTAQRMSDRWFHQKQGAASLATVVQRLGAGTMGNLGDYQVPIPGTNQIITNTIGRITLNAQLPTLNAGDLFYIRQFVEGPNFKILQGDVHSFSLLVRTSVANLSFGVTLTDNSGVSLTKLCTITSTNAWTLISLPNLPVWPNNGIFNSVPAQLGYVITITLAAGSTWMTPANDTWQNAIYYGAVGQSNFGAAPVGSTFDLAFVQHEPGNVCTTLMPKPFSENLDECYRYFCKSYNYGVIPSGLGTGYAACFTSPYAVAAPGPIPVWGTAEFTKPMWRTPAISVWNNSNGQLGTAYLTFTGFAAPVLVNGIAATEKGIFGATLNGNTSGASLATFYWAADTSW